MQPPPPPPPHPPEVGKLAQHGHGKCGVGAADGGRGVQRVVDEVGHKGSKACGDG